MKANNNELVKVQKESLYGVVGKDAKVIIPFEYTDIEIIDNGAIIASKGSCVYTFYNGKLVMIFGDGSDMCDEIAKYGAKSFFS